MSVRRDWRAVSEELEQLGVTPYKQAEVIGRRTRRITAIRNGAEPKHSEGETLLALLELMRRGQKGPIATTEEVTHVT